MCAKAISTATYSKSNFLRKHFNPILAGVVFLLTYVPTLIWMWDRWFLRDSYYSHGILVPFVTGYLIWQRKDDLGKLPAKSSTWGIPLIVAGILIHLVSSMFRIYFSSGFSMIMVLSGLVLNFYGSQIFKRILFPIAFLAFMIPVPLVMIANISFQMKTFAAQIATILLNNMGLPAIREGSVIKMQHAHVIVEDVCSGLRSLISLTALGSIFAYLMPSTYPKRIVLFLSTIPIAIVTNVFRIIFLSAIAEIWGAEYAGKTVHDVSGFLVFVLAFIMLFAVGKLLE